MTVALARKYRPKSFDDLIGQESVAQTLSQALNQDRLSHAYLFSGLRGSGKTSTARIFAKSLLCEKGVSAKPCETCEQCRMANESRHMDIIEMDAASNRKIDDIRDLIEHTKYKPSIGRYKVFIIDEVHMLTKEAFNAILKTLEEPPDFVKFILATTDPLKIPATILSRSQHFRFKKISKHLVMGHLEHILNLEQIEFDSNALETLARSGAGSLRDTLTLLDQAIVYSNNHITQDVVTQMLGIIDPAHLDELLRSLLAKDRDAVLRFCSEFSEYEAEMILDELTVYLKEKLLAKDKQLTPLIIERFFRVISESKHLLTLGSDEEFVLTLTLFKMLEALSIKEIDSMIEDLESSLGKQSKGVEPKNETAQQAASRPEPTPVPAPEPPKQKTPFELLKEQIFDKSYELGECFEENIEFVSFEGGSLTWNSSAEGECKAMLRDHFKTIKELVDLCFGSGTKIVNQNVEKPRPTQHNEPAQEMPETPEPASQSGSMVEDVETKHCDSEGASSCMENSAPLQDTPASEELNAKEIVNEPMIKKAAQLFKPEKIKIKPKI